MRWGVEVFGLRFCQERLRAQSPTPPLLKPKRLKGVGLYASEREVAEEVAAWSVSLTLTRVLRIMQAQKLQAQLEANLQTAEVEEATRLAEGLDSQQRHPQVQIQQAHQQVQMPQAHQQPLQLVQQQVQMAQARQQPLQPAHQQAQMAQAHQQPLQPAHQQVQMAQAHPQPLVQPAHQQVQNVQHLDQMPRFQQQSQIASGQAEFSSQSAGTWQQELPQLLPTSLTERGSFRSGLPAIQEHSEQASLLSPSHPEGAGMEAGPETATWRDAVDSGTGARWHMGQEERWGGDFISAFEEDLDEEVSRIADQRGAEKTSGPAKTASHASPSPVPATSPVPETGGTPTPNVEEPETIPCPKCSVIRKLATTQTSPTDELEEATAEPEKTGKALISAQEENRVLKLVVANSKKEIAYYNHVLVEKNAEHQQELQELQDTMLQERRRCTEDMMQWKKHVKKELGRDPVLSVCLFMWEREVTSLRTQYAFTEWKRKTSQIQKARGISGKMSLLVELHWVLRDWRLSVMEQKAQRMKTQLHEKWFKSIEQASYAWGRDMAQGLKHFAFAGWVWQKKFGHWERKSSRNVQFTLRRWFYAMDTAVRYFAFLAWYEALMEVKLQNFRFQLLGKKSAFLKAVMAFDASVSSMSMRAIFYAWVWSTPAIQGTPFSKPDRPENLAPARMDQSSRFNLAFCLSAWDNALTGAVISSWHHIARHSYFQRAWMKYFRPENDLRPLLQGWRLQVKRANEAQTIYVQVEKKEEANTWFVSLLCFVYWRMKLMPSRAVVSYVPKLARCKEIAVRKLGEAEERSVFLVIFHAWQMYLLLSQEEKEEDVPDEAQEASETGRPCISSLVNRAVKKQRAKDEEKKLEADKAMKASDRKSVEEAQAKVAALEKSLKDSEDAKAKVTALEQNVKDLEEKNAEEKAKVEKLEAEAKKNKSCCCILQ